MTEMTIRQRVEATLYGNALGREGSFEAVAAEVLGMTSEQVEEALKAEAAEAADLRDFCNHVKDGK